jgi:hypothetical protein
MDQDMRINQNQQEDNTWGQWLVGEANAAPASQEIPLPHLDLNQVVAEDAQQPMDLDLNADLDLNVDPDPEIIIPEIEEEVQIEQDQVSVSISDGHLIKSDSSA